MPPTEPNSPDYEIVSEDELREWPDDLPRARRARMAKWARGLLLLMAAGFVAVFAVAAWLNPYNADGSPRTMSTHTQLGMPRCNMEQMLGKPCPACGMTTSFALLVHGDVLASLRANWCGTLLAVFWMLLIPWGILSAVRGRTLFVRNAELAATVAVGIAIALMIGRWVVVLFQ